MTTLEAKYKAQEKAMKSLFILCNELKQQVKDLSGQVKTLSEEKHKCNVSEHKTDCVEQINKLNEHTGKQ